MNARHAEKKSHELDDESIASTDDGGNE